MENRTLSPVSRPATRAPRRATTNTNKATPKGKGKPAPAPAPPPPTPADAQLAALCAALLALIVAHQATATSRPVLALLAALRGLLAIAAPHQGDPGGHRLDAFTTSTGPDGTPPASSSTPSTSSSSTTRSTTTTAPSLPPGQRRLWGHLAGSFDAWGQLGQTLAALDLTVRSLDDEPDQLGLQSELNDRAEELRAAHFNLAGMLCEASAEVTGLCVRDNPVAHAARLRELVDLDSPRWWIEHRRETILASAREAFATSAARTT